MDHAIGPSISRRLVRRAQVTCDRADAVEHLIEALGTGPFALVILFVSAAADFRAVVATASAAFAGTEVIGCTTAGEIGDTGYCDGTIVAVGFPRDLFAASVVVVPDMARIDGQDLADTMIMQRNALARSAPGFADEFVFLMVDGLSGKEDDLTAQLAAGLGAAPLFGGSAGDGTAFGRTYVCANGTVHRNAAVLALVRTACRIRVFKTDHLRPTDCRMVVTGADPARRIVREINAEPAAREYARILGKDPDQLTTYTFAAHPVVVRMGGQHHVRAIQRVTDEGDLLFFCAIDEGLVLTLAEPDDMVAHLERVLGGLAKDGAPALVLACDCILRRHEAQEKQLTGAISRLLEAHGVVGFSTYGEQFNSMHVNQTLTGVAIYAPERSGP